MMQRSYDLRQVCVIFCLCLPLHSYSCNDVQHSIYRLLAASSTTQTNCLDQLQPYVLKAVSPRRFLGPLSNSTTLIGSGYMIHGQSYTTPIGSNITSHLNNFRLFGVRYLLWQICKLHGRRNKWIKSMLFTQMQ
jgi:hypothetical protein